MAKPFVFLASALKAKNFQPTQNCWWSQGLFQVSWQPPFPGLKRLVSRARAPYVQFQPSCLQLCQSSGSAVRGDLMLDEIFLPLMTRQSAWSPGSSLAFFSSLGKHFCAWISYYCIWTHTHPGKKPLEITAQWFMHIWWTLFATRCAISWIISKLHICFFLLLIFFGGGEELLLLLLLLSSYKVHWKWTGSALYILCDRSLNLYCPSDRLQMAKLSLSRGVNE